MTSDDDVIRHQRERIALLASRIAAYDQRNTHLMALYDAILPYYRRRHPDETAELHSLSKQSL